MEKIFKLFLLIGNIVIVISSFILLKNPFKIIPGFATYGFDKPLWLCVSVSGQLIFSIIIYFIYNNFINK